MGRCLTLPRESATPRSAKSRSCLCGDRDYDRRQELRITTRKRNAINRIDRHRVVMSERTAIFTAIYEAAEQTAPMFARELKEACGYAQLDATLAGYVDGSLAYSLAYAKLFQAKRSKADVDFYDAAKQIQKRTTLNDGCRASEFVSKAHAWIYKIRPYLAQPYSDEDAAEYLAELMPMRLGGDERRLKDKFESEGKLAISYNSRVSSKRWSMQTRALRRLSLPSSCSMKSWAQDSISWRLPT